MKNICWICLALFFALILSGPAGSREKGAVVFDRMFKDSGWQVQLKSFTVGARCRAGWFEASLSDNRYLRLSADRSVFQGARQASAQGHAGDHCPTARQEYFPAA